MLFNLKINESAIWIKYFIVIFITAIIVSLVMERIVLNRIGLTEGVELKFGKCRIKNGYGDIKNFMKVNNLKFDKNGSIEIE